MGGDDMKLRPVMAALIIAVCWFSQLMAASPPATPASAQQLLSQGLQYLQEQQWAEALAAFRQAYTPSLRQHLPPTWQQRLPFLLGYLYVRTGEDSKATLHLERARESLPALRDYTLWYLGQALLRLNRLQPARAALQGLLQAYPESLHRPEALFAMAEVNRRLGDLARAAELYVQYQREYPKGPQRGNALLGLGMVYRDMGEPAEALRVWRSLWLEFPEDPAAEAVPQLERTLPSTFAVPPLAPTDLYRRAERLFQLHRYREALSAFELAQAASPGHELAPETLYQIGMAQYHTRDNAAALETFRQLYEGAPQGPWAPVALFMQARLALRTEQDDAFLDLARALMARFPSSKEAEEVGYLLGHFHRNRGRVAEAMQAFQQVMERGKRSEFADAAWWYVGWLQYGAGEYERAAQTWGRLLNAFPASSLVSETLYWQGRALERAGHQAEARARFERLRTSYPQTYYGYLATARLNGHAPWPWELPGDAWARDGLSPSASPPELPPVPGTDPHARRGSEFWAMRLYAEAGEEFQAVPANGAQGALCQLYAALAYHQAGEHSRALYLLRRYGKNWLRQDVVISKAELQEMTYPLGALRRLDASTLDGIDPLFVGALIMAESDWNPRALSRVGARGLMQLMPETGQRLAQSIGVGLASEEQLFDPSLNLKLGVAYLRQLLQRFDGLLPLTLASYNAGEAEVSKWWAKRGTSDIEEFIADMPFRETRRYVQRVLVYYAEYRRIYRGRQS
jgi:soluble lytic murein transglycosylase